MVKQILVISLFFFCASANPLSILRNLENGQLNPISVLESLQLTNLNNADVTSYLKSENLNYASQLATNLNNREIHPEWGLNTVQLIKRHGYPVEKHTVTTEDGYILGLQRIPHGRNNDKFEQKPVVLIMAGILCSSADWVVSGPEKALAFILADKGYDVWLGNNRGTTLSRKHVTLKPNKDKEFWNFSYHEMGIFDLPAMIDYILEETQQPNLFYIAHSQGATSFFVMASEKPDYNNKIRLMTALAPVTYSSNVKNPFIRLLLPSMDDLMAWAEKKEMYEFLRHSRLFTLMGQALCNDEARTQDLCAIMLFLATGFDSPQLNKTMLPVIFSNFPAGASMKQFWHFAQGMKSNDKFQQFDYGTEENVIIYGQETPPEYDLTKVTAPVSAFYSQNDWISSDVDVHHLISVLPNVKRNHLVEYRKFNHLDYMWAIDAKLFVYDYVIQDMENY